MEWTKGKNKLVFNHIGYKWAVLMLKIGSFEISLDHNIKNLSVGISFDRWLLTKQLSFSFLTLSLVITWYTTNNDYWEL